MAAIQRSFSGGILSPTLFGRADQQKYLTGLRTCTNFIPTPSGAAVNRAGFEFISEIVDSTTGARLVPFIFNDAQTYVLEFGAGYIRFIRNGVLLAPEGAVAYNGASTYNLADLVTYGGHTYYSNIDANVGHAPDVSPTQWTAMLDDSVYNIVSEYTADEIAAIRYIQSADVMTLFHPNHAPANLSRLGDTKWTLVDITTAASIGAPTGLVAVAGVSPGTAPTAPAGLGASGGDVAAPQEDFYIVTAFNGAAESVRSAETHSGTNGATAALPITITWGAVAGALGYAIYKRVGALGNFTIVGISLTTSFEDGLTASFAGAVKFAPGTSTTDSRTFTYKVTAIADADGTESSPSTAATCSGQEPTSSHPNVLTWAATTGAKSYNVYKANSGGVYGYIGSAITPSFSDASITPDASFQPPVNRDLFSSSDDYPTVGTYFQQRLGVASSTNDPEKVWLSRVGSYYDFTQATPIADDDPVIFTAAGERANTIRQMATINGKLILGTQDGIWSLDGDQSGVVTPTSINLRQQIYGGCSDLRLLPIENTALYVQARGSVVRDLVYSWQSNGYTGHDLTIFAPHLFATYTLVDWAYQQIPYSLVWAARDDGALLSLTYNHEQEVWGWAEHNTGVVLDAAGAVSAQDSVEAVCCVPEGTEDALYAIMARAIGGTTKRYIERLHTRVVNDVRTDAFFVDSGLAYDGRNTGSTTIEITGGSTWAYTESVTLVASVAQFVPGDVGKAYRLSIGGVDCTVVVATVIDTLHATGHAQTDIPLAFRNVATAAWALAVKTVSGLGHLEGRVVSACIDGSAQRSITVMGGAAALARYGAVIAVGLPIVADLGSLDWEDPSRGTMIDKQKRVNRVSVMVDNSRGFEVGEDASTLTAYKQRIDERPGDDAYLLSTTIDIPIAARWNSGGRIYLRQRDPLPMTVLSVAITGLVGA